MKDLKFKREQQRLPLTSDSITAWKKEKAQSQFAIIRNSKRKRCPHNTNNKKRTINKT